jgi:phosphatidylglycerol:prolipoprotein diacylglycerol transferase
MPSGAGTHAEEGRLKIMPGLIKADAAWAGAWLLVAAGLVLVNFDPDGAVAGRLDLAALPVNLFGLLVVTNLFFALYLAKQACVGRGLDWERFRLDLVWIIAGGFYLSHLTSLALYSPSRLSDPVAWLDVRTGLSSFGGMYGGLAIATWLLRRRGLPVWAYVDVLVYGFVGGYAFGRAACFLVHDHPGITTDFVLGVEIDGVMRHDLGFYEMLLMAGMTVFFTAVGARVPTRPGWIAALGFSIYAPIRFLFDTLRVGDPRYASLTPGQWFSILSAGVAIWAWITVLRGSDAPRWREREPAPG